MVPILEYHDIEYIPHDKYGMAPAAFAEQMEFLHDHGFHTITLLQLYDAFYGHGTLPPRPIVLTFDDGYQSVYTTAYPILRRFGFVGTVFVITGYVGHGPHMLTWSELREMQDSGVMDVESHTVHHVNLAKAPPAVVQQELLDSQVTIVRQLHHPCRFFCYPFGGYSRVAIEDLHRDGYWLATTSRTGYATPADGPYRLRRLQVYEGEPITAFSEMLQPSFRGPVVS
jgi:peptidoglycan/xylan/chitin deacetylase (PgdA/CDA1 family)